MTPKTKPSGKTAKPTRLFLLAMIAVAALMASLFYKSNPLPNRAAGYAQNVATSAAATYVTLRTLNAVLSTVQEASFTGSVVVAEATVQPLKSLEPIDDTIERIADVVFALMLASGVLSVAMGPVSAIGAGMMSLACLIWLIDLVIGRRNPLSGAARRLVWYGAFLGLGLPLAFLLSDPIAVHLTNGVAESHQAIIATIMADVETTVTPLSDTQGWLAWLRELSNDVDRYYALAESTLRHADDLIASFISLVSVYLFRLLFLPAILAGAALVVFRFFARSQV